MVGFLTDMDRELRRNHEPGGLLFLLEGETIMGRTYTPEQEIVNLRAKRKITHQEASRRLRVLAREEEVEKVAEETAEAKANSGIRGALRSVINYFTS